MRDIILDEDSVRLDNIGELPGRSPLGPNWTVPV